MNNVQQQTMQTVIQKKIYDRYGSPLNFFLINGVYGDVHEEYNSVTFSQLI